MRQDRRVNKQIQLTSHRTAALAVAVVLSAAASVSAQTIDTNIFGGTNVTDPNNASLQITSVAVSSTVGVGQQNSATVGPNFSAFVSLPLGLNTSLTESINTGDNGSLVVGENSLIAGVGAGLAGNFSATKTFSNATFAAGQYYQLTLTRSENSALSLLSGTDITLSTNGTTVLNTADPNGLLGVVNVLGLFGTGNTATITFQAPLGVSTSTPITFALTGGVTASALNSNFTFTGASLTAVPEPGTLAAVSAGAFGLAMTTLRRRRQS